MKKVIKILLIILGIIIFLFLALIGFVWYSYKITPDPRERQAYLSSQYKYIYFVNKLDSTNLFIKINLEYTEQDSLAYSKTKIDSTMIMPYSTLDSVMLVYYSSNSAILNMPILNNDSLKFPKNFYVKIYNKDKSQLLKELNYNSFMEHAIPEYIANKENLLTAQQWTLVIDSTLLDLKKKI